VGYGPLSSKRCQKKAFAKRISQRSPAAKFAQGVQVSRPAGIAWQSGAHFQLSGPGVNRWFAA
jgi:hypothetical protein